MTAISTRLPEVTIEYDSKKGRTTKTFADANAAKGYFTKLSNTGKNPKLIGNAADVATAADSSPAATEATAAPTTALQAPTTAPAVATTPDAKPAIPGVAPNAKTRHYFAAKIIKQHGHAAGITDAMVAELDRAYGKPNKIESEIALRTTWHAIRAWQE